MMHEVFLQNIKANPEEVDPGLFTNYTNEQLAVIRDNYNSIKSNTPMADLRRSISDIVGFRQVHDLDNIELKDFTTKASVELDMRERHARVNELRAIIEAADGTQDDGVLRAKLGEAGIDFKAIRNMNSLDLAEFIQDAREELVNLAPIESEKDKESDLYIGSERIKELKAIIKTYDSAKDMGEQRARLSALLGFKKVYEMDDFAIKAMVYDAKAELESILEPKVEPVTTVTSETQKSQAYIERDQDLAKMSKKVEKSEERIFDQTSFNTGIAAKEVADHCESDEVKKEGEAQIKEVLSTFSLGRLKYAWSRMKEYLYKQYDELKEDLNYLLGYRDDGVYLIDDIEKQKRFKRGTITAAIGASAVAISVYIGARYGLDVFGHHGANPTAHSGDLSPHDTESISPSGAGGSIIHHHEAHKAIAETLSYSGDTIWYHAKSHLVEQGIKNPSNQQIYEYTSKILKANHLSWNDARHLPVGFKFRMP